MGFQHPHTLLVSRRLETWRWSATFEVIFDKCNTSDNQFTFKNYHTTLKFAWVFFYMMIAIDIHSVPIIACNAPPPLRELWFNKGTSWTEPAETEARHCTSTWPSPIKLPSYKPIYISECYPTIYFSPSIFHTHILPSLSLLQVNKGVQKKGNLNSALSHQMST
jgi:hypothetical protein